MTKHLIGIDLHGTLLDPQWRIPAALETALSDALESLKETCEIAICSGNDLFFINRYLPEHIRKHFDDYVLETGCVISNGLQERVIISPEATADIMRLNKLLQQEKIPGVKYFARRLASISLFTKHENSGIDPASIYQDIVRRVARAGFAGRVMVTHSDVAVDIIPNSYDKLTGLQYLADGRMIIGIADSFNDLAMITGADLAYLPANAGTRLLEELQSRKLRVGNHDGTERIIMMEHGFTRGVIDALEHIRSRILKGDRK